MKTSINHLPEHKQVELREIVDIIRGAATIDLLIILFGSYSRGTWVEDRYQDELGTTYSYESDFDILVVVDKHSRAQNRSIWNKVERRIERRPTIKTWVSLITQHINGLNKDISEGQYFYLDIIKEGTVLYDSGAFELVEAKELSPKERQTKAQNYFDYWFKSANSFLINFNHAYARDDLLNAAFELHQATERLFMTVLLVFTDYKPKLHDLRRLNKQVVGQDNSFQKVFPNTTKEERRYFELLRSAYIDSRYNMDWKITKEELTWLKARVFHLQTLTEQVCKQKIHSFAQ